ncbi:MAG: oligosaccharide flippase family protein [Muribaculaceae bacterium]|nr:oligosaccharide flippase family protein [Muribaculaceae bacterium]
MTDITANNKRIAKNTLLLYFRTFITLLVTLYTSRVILQILGETDFGIYNIIGGVILIFSFLSNALAVSTQRFMSFEMGKNNENAVRKVFSMSLTVHIFIVLIIITLAETIGLWFLETKMNIPNSRMYAAHWVYQLSILSCCVNILRVPYNACIISYEKMSFYAYISIIEAVLKLLGVYFLLVFIYDKLIVYSFLMFLVMVLVSLSYKIYCNKKFNISRYKFFWDKQLFYEMTSFSVWSLFGSAANMAASHGVAIVVNIFCGVVANAALGIANQVSHAVSVFITNFQTAFSPQLMKSYAASNQDYFMSLIYKTSRYSYYLMLLLGFPLILCCEPILNLWLGNVPVFTVQFTQLMIVFCMIDAMSGPLWISVQATGKIKNYQILMCCLISINLPIAYIILKLGYSPVWVLVAKVVINMIVHFIRIIYLKKVIKLQALDYIKKVMIRVVSVTIISVPLPYIFYYYNHDKADIFIAIILSVLMILLSVLVIGISNEERNLLLSKFSSRIINNDQYSKK